MLCLPCDTGKYNYRKSGIVILITALYMGVYAMLHTAITEIQNNGLVTESQIIQILLAIVLLSIGISLFFSTQYCSQCEQIKNHQDLVHELYQQCDFDMLSGLKNRNSFIRFAQQIENQSNGVSVMICDIDGLKIINDTLGHMAGDTIVRKVGEILSASLSSEAQLFRIGGDEYIIVIPKILPEAELQKNKKLIKEKIASYNACQSSIPLSMSIGFATSSPNSCQFWDVTKLADYNMYQEKRTCQEKVYRNLKVALVE